MKYNDFATLWETFTVRTERELAEHIEKALRTHKDSEYQRKFFFLTDVDHEPLGKLDKVLAMQGLVRLSDYQVLGIREPEKDEFLIGIMPFAEMRTFQGVVKTLQLNPRRTRITLSEDIPQYDGEENTLPLILNFLGWRITRGGGHGEDLLLVKQDHEEPPQSS